MVTSTIGSGWLLGGMLAFSLAQILLISHGRTAGFIGGWSGWINLTGVGWLARWIDGLTAWKLAIPLLISITLMLASGHWGNLRAIPQAPTQTLQGVVSAISSGGIVLSLLGFRTAMALGLGISLAIDVILQLTFLVSLPPDHSLAAGPACNSPPMADC